MAQAVLGRDVRLDYDRSCGPLAGKLGFGSPAGNVAGSVQFSAGSVSTSNAEKGMLIRTISFVDMAAGMTLLAGVSGIHQQRVSTDLAL